MKQPAYFGGYYEGDCYERAMVNKIIAVLQLRGGTTPLNYQTVYQFIEHDWGGIVWDTYYRLFKTMHPEYVGPFDKRCYNRFKKAVKKNYACWKSGKTYRGPKVSD